MKIGIHKNPGSYGDSWIQYCEENDIPYKLVNCYDSDIVTQLNDCNGLMWHWNQNDYKAALFARQLTLSLEKKGVKVFPDVGTGWHHNDKVGQKYLLESVNAPLVKSYVFYSKKEALAWLHTTTFPKVFKLRGGASSVNVRLVTTKQQGKVLINKAFGKGFLHINRFYRFKDRVRLFKLEKDKKNARGILSGLVRIFFPTEVEKFSHREKGYIYFQDFIPGNKFDTRLVVIGNRCFGLIRYCRDGDFRASGSNVKDYDPKLLDKKCVKIAFDVTKKLNAQSLAFDFIWDSDCPKIVEISYCFGLQEANSTNCVGYWDADLNWFTPVNPTYFMIEDFIKKLK